MFAASKENYQCHHFWLNRTQTAEWGYVIEIFILFDAEKCGKKKEENYFTKHTNSSMSSKTVKWGYVIKIFRVLMEKKDGNYFTKLLMSSETAKLEIMLLKYSDVWWQKTWKLFCNIIDELRNLKYIMKFSMSPKHEYFYEVNFLGWVL